MTQKPAKPAKPAAGVEPATPAPAATPVARGTRATDAKPAKPGKPATPGERPATSRAPLTSRRKPSHDEISERAYFIDREEGGLTKLQTGCARSASWRLLRTRAALIFDLGCRFAVVLRTAGATSTDTLSL